MVVHHELDSRVERESALKKKLSTATHMHTLWKENIDHNNLSAPHEEKTHQEALNRQRLKGDQGSRKSKNGWELTKSGCHARFHNYQKAIYLLFSN